MNISNFTAIKSEALVWLNIRKGEYEFTKKHGEFLIKYQANNFPWQYFSVFCSFAITFKIHNHILLNFQRKEDTLQFIFFLARA